MGKRTNTNTDMDWSEDTDINETDVPVSEDRGRKGGRTTTDDTGETGWEPGLTDDEMEERV